MSASARGNRLVGAELHAASISSAVASFLQAKDRFVDHRAQNAIDDKTRRIFTVIGVLPSEEARPCAVAASRR